MDYKMLFSPMKIGTCEIKNRLVMSPMLVGMGEFDGKTTEQLMDYYEERAKGGTGLIITEITRINDVTGSAAFAQLAMSKDYQIEGMREFANRIHKHGAKLFVQLHHPGRQNVGLAIGTVPFCIAATRVCKKFPNMLFKIAPKIAPTLEKHDISLSAVAPSKCERAYFANTKVRALSHKEVKKLIQQFIDGAVRCKKAGVDGVQLHASHGYLIQQFLSPYTNQRTDEYGGSLENRFRFLKEIIEGVKKECGDDYPVIVRITADEFYEKEGKCGKAGDGYTLKDCLEYAKMIEAAGVNAIDVSSAGYDRFNYWLEPTSFELGWRKYLAAEVKKVVSIPVIAANLIRTPEQAEQQLEEGVQDFISMGRPHIADPYFAKKAQEGRSEDIKRCICCLYCIESMEVNAYHGTCAHCSVNPAMGREREYNSMTKDGNGRTVVIVGAGMAGLVSAEILAKRGFKPVVLEKADKVGGQILLAAAPPHKEKIGWCVKDAETAAVKAGAEIRLNTLATPELIDSLNPYAIIVATGAVAVKPRSIKGSDGANVYTTTELLDGSVKLENKKLVIVGSGMTGLETAEMLVGQGNKLTIVEMLDEVAKGVWFQHKDDALPKLNAAGTEFILSHKLCSIDENGITICPVKQVKNKNYKKELKEGKRALPTIAVEDGDPKHYDFDAVILSLGSRPVNDLMKALEGKCEGRVFSIGDATKIGRIADATEAAYQVASKLK